jgi:hypothetical protein
MGISNPQMDIAGSSFPIANSTFLFFYLAILSNCQVHYGFWAAQMCFKLPKLKINKFLSCPRPECFFTQTAQKGRVYNIRVFDFFQ